MTTIIVTNRAKERARGTERQRETGRHSRDGGRAAKAGHSISISSLPSSLLLSSSGGVRNRRLAGGTRERSGGVEVVGWAGGRISPLSCLPDAPSLPPPRSSSLPSLCPPPVVGRSGRSVGLDGFFALPSSLLPSHCLDRSLSCSSSFLPPSSQSVSQSVSRSIGHSSSFLAGRGERDVRTRDAALRKVSSCIILLDD